ncbi:MAG: bifunctional glutamine synthetase adenylyltransferase/deadenyltransferase [Cycloclasticus sp. symbiont of Bathymodiolus heckerae]|nr:MAG: bifunctional glutamine synthetase adenylyltransferase/deadenyltransferase [Cycloclasticus sp. symbiont of Bathymodiolus heckerae]
MDESNQALKDYIEQSTLELPSALQLGVQDVWHTLVSELSDNGSIPGKSVIDDVTRLLACSEFVQKQAVRHAAVVIGGFDSTRTEKLQLSIAFQEELQATIGSAKDEASVLRVLRQSRNQRMLLIAWADLTGADVSDVINGLSKLADCYIQTACDWAHKQLCARYGIPKDVDGVEQKLITIGMGKLGAHELNFSSDIDLIFCYPFHGDTDGTRSISNEEFFTRQCRLIVKLLDQQTADGFVFRVDTRLRPFGDSGALVLSSDGMEHYYQSHAREWERYAMVKARLITGEEHDKNQLMSMIKAFVFRRYLDYGVFDSIRVMKREIEAQLQRKGVEHNVKLGPGGIREIEFIGQAYQLIRGGRDESLQTRGILDVLTLLADKGHVPAGAVEELSEDYGYLRRLENRIQEMADKQAHELPKDELEQARLVLAMKVSSWGELLDSTHQVMARVHSYFESLVDFSSPLEPNADIGWIGLDEAVLEQYLEAKGISASDAVRRDIVDFCQSYPVRKMQEKGRQYFTRLMPLLIDALLVGDSHERTLSVFLKMLEKICNRTAYLVLLVENNAVFGQLIRLAKLSPLIITQVTKAPILLDELIDPANLYNPPSKNDLNVELDKAVAQIEQGDIESQMEVLRHFKQVNVLRVAAADLTGVIPLMVVSDKLTAIAEVVVEKAVLFCWQSVCAQYGVPAGASADNVSGFAVIAFGKMGGMELGFSSDLDVIFLHKNAEIDDLTTGDKPVSLGEFYMRLGRKIITFMTTNMFSGRLYEIDLRLRPNGNSGLLVTSESSFEKYQKQQAWTWEHQALIRARFVAGCDRMGVVFNVIRQKILIEPRDSDALRKDIVEMREKMREALLKTKLGYFDLKHGVGGIVDIEFIVQFGVLANASEHTELLKYTDNVNLLIELHRIGFLSSSEKQELSQAYKAYREAAHHASLAETSTMVDDQVFDEHIQRVGSVWKNKFIN